MQVLYSQLDNTIRLLIHIPFLTRHPVLLSVPRLIHPKVISALNRTTHMTQKYASADITPTVTRADWVMFLPAFRSNEHVCIPGLTGFVGFGLFEAR